MIAALSARSGVFIEIEGEQWEILRQTAPPKFNTVEDAMKWPGEMAKNPSYEEYLKLSVCPWREDFITKGIYIESHDYIAAPYILNIVYNEEKKQMRYAVLKSPKWEEPEVACCG
jgi:hypothetical protein